MGGVVEGNAAEREKQEEHEASESLVAKFCGLSLDTGGLENRVATARMAHGVRSVYELIGQSINRSVESSVSSSGS